MDLVSASLVVGPSNLAAVAGPWLILEIHIGELLARYESRTTKQAACSSTDQGGGKRRAAISGNLRPRLAAFRPLRTER
jgi:hypothetical protein